MQKRRDLMTYTSTDQTTALHFIHTTTFLMPCVFRVIWSLLPIAIPLKKSENKFSWLSRIIFLILLSACAIEDSANIISHSNLRENISPDDCEWQGEILIGRKSQSLAKWNEPIHSCSLSNYDVDVEAINTLINQIIRFDVIGYLNLVIKRSYVFEIKN